MPFVPAGTTKLVKGVKVFKSADKASDVAKGVDKVADANHAKELIKKRSFWTTSKTERAGQ